jgi:hypothetical protein
MELEDYKRAKQLQEETLPAFERLKKAVSAGTLDKATIKEIGDSFANAMFYENDFEESLEELEGLIKNFKKKFSSKEWKVKIIRNY